MTHLTLATTAVALSLIIVACGSNGVDSTVCQEGQYSSQAVPDTGWRVRIQQALASAPSDSGLGVAFFYASDITDTDLADLKARGADPGYRFRGFPAVLADISVANMRALAADDTASRIVNAALGQRVIPLGCH
jgi:hypothetical protein